jgi:hypothetical protein
MNVDSARSRSHIQKHEVTRYSRDVFRQGDVRMSHEQLFFLYPLLAGVLVWVGWYKLDQSRFTVRGVVGPYFAALALLFGLFASLTAGDVWQRVARANTLVVTEVNSLRSLLRLAEAQGIAEAAVLQAVQQYAVEIEKHEFGSTAEEAADAAPLESMRALYRIAVDSSMFAGNPQVQAHFLASLDTARGARLERLELRKAHLAPVKLQIIFLFGLLTQIAIALCHAGNPRALGAAVMLFSIAFAICVGILTTFDDPQAFARLVSDRVLTDLR